ncbi:MAG TPA: hypothetical protein VNW97_19460 [Candidatus Saccharimonadales bacterium]|nr:hypothetical protein [Candidatus Saccharimonadales bacterium]
MFIGFWTDWSYLTEIVADSFISVHCPLVVLVDPAATGVLQAKAPGLWNWAHSSGVDFVHVPEYGEPFLECLRTEYSKTLLAQVLRSAESSFHAVAPGQPIPSQTFDAAHVDDLYQLRRDFAGVAFNRAPKLPNKADMVGVGRIHLRLRAKGCRLDGSSYVTTENQRIRVVNGKTDVLSDVQARHRDEPNKPIEDKYVICPGAFDAGGAASNIARPQKAASIVRPGGSGEWITEEAAYEKGLI